MELLMSVKERDCLKIVSQLAGPGGGAGKLTQAQAADLLGCTERHVRRLVRRYEHEGDAGLVHKSRGRPSNRCLPQEFREQVMVQVRKHYRDFGPTLAAEMLAERHGLSVSRETLRQWMIAEELWKPKRRKAVYRQRRPRRECFGELVQIDTSEHDWFEGRGESAVLITLIDDATSRVTMRFFEADDTQANMTILRDYIALHGRPMAFYGDKASHFRVNRPASVEEQLEGLEPETQIGRALRELDITWFTAHSPQAKGRVERSFDTAQDRLVKLMRLDNIRTIEEANRFLQERYMPQFNERFTVPPACDTDAHRTCEGLDLDAIFSHQEERVVTRDYTIRFKNQRYQIKKESAAPGLVQSKLIVEQRLDGSIWLRWRDQYLQFVTITPTPTGAAAALPVGLRPPYRAAAKGTAVTPKADHPWKKPYKGDSRPQRQ
jgi:transposase